MAIRVTLSVQTFSSSHAFFPAQLCFGNTGWSSRLICFIASWQVQADLCFPPSNAPAFVPFLSRLLVFLMWLTQIRLLSYFCLWRFKDDCFDSSWQAVGGSLIIFVLLNNNQCSNLSLDFEVIDLWGGREDFILYSLHIILLVSLFPFFSPATVVWTEIHYLSREIRFYR